MLSALWQWDMLSETCRVSTAREKKAEGRQKVRKDDGSNNFMGYVPFQIDYWLQGPWIWAPFICVTRHNPGMDLSIKRALEERPKGTCFLDIILGGERGPSYSMLSVMPTW